MGLIKLFISEFKSYSGLHEITLDGLPFVSVVGPNGSGKSNLLDAICFLIGMSPTQLRCKSFEELCHTAGSEMFVSATVSDKSENTRVFKRTVSEFYVDGHEVSENSYASHWAGINVIPDARNCVVLQGDIESLASAQADSLANLIESLRPNRQHDLQAERENYKKLEQELAEATNQTRVSMNLRRTAQAEVEQALELTNAGERLAALRSKLHMLEKRRQQLVVAERRAVLSEMQRKLDEVHASVDSYRTESELVETDSRKLRADYARKRRQLQNARNAEQEAQELLLSTEAKLVPLQKKREALRAEQRLLEPDLEFAKQSLETAQREVDASQRALSVLERAQEQERAREDSEISESSLRSRKARDLWMKLDSEFMSETALQQDEFDELRRQANLAKQRVDTESRHIEDLSAELAIMTTRVQQKEQRAQQLNSLVDERTSQQEQRRQELQEVADELTSLRSEQRSLTQTLRDLNEKIRVADGNRRALTRRHKLLDAVERLRRSHRGGVYDILGNLIQQTETKYAGAVERALGQHADAIVVDTAETAIACVSQARRERLGALSFLPVADLQNRELGSARAQVARQVAEGKEARLLVDCVEFDRKFRPAVLFALSDSVFVPSFSMGLDLRRSGLKMRIIDVNGSVISSNNIMSSSSGETSLSSASDRTLAAMQRKAHNVAEKLKLNASRETDLKDTEIRLNGQIDRSIQTIEGAQSEVSVAKEQLRGAQAAAKNSEKVLTERQHVLSELDLASENAQKELEVFLKELNGMRTKKFASFISEMGGTLAEWDARFARGSQRFAEFSRQRQRIDDRLQLAIERRDAASHQLSKQKQRAKVLQSSLQQTDGQLSALDAEAHSASQKVERAEARLRSLRSETEAKSDEVGTAESALDAVRARLAEAERQEHLQGVALAAEIGEEQSDSSEVDARDGEGSDSDISQRIGQRRLAKQRQGSTRNRNGKKIPEKEALSIDRLDKKISELRSEMEPLLELAAATSGTDQNDAATQASQRCMELNETGDAARAYLQNVSSRFAEIRSERASKFKEILEQLQSSLSAIYLELAGGDAQARLTPINSEEPFCGIEFTVMPPGKSFVPVSQLSGGERSMAALALLFSCQRLYPSPFVVLDEVDAALDFENVASISRYVRSHSSETQFLIVSLKQRLFQSATHLVGVYKQRVQSKLVTVAL